MRRLISILVCLFAVGCGSEVTPTLVPSPTPLPTSTPTPVPTPTPTPQPPEPATVVESLMNTVGRLDIEEASQYFCKDRETLLEERLKSGLEPVEAMGMDPDGLLETLKIEMSNLVYTEESKGNDRAVVHITGSMLIEFDTDKLKLFIQSTAEEQGQTVSDEELGFIVMMFNVMGVREFAIDDDIELIKQDEKWVVCDELGFFEWNY